MFNLSLLQLRLEQHLECYNELRALLSGQIHIAEFALTQRPANIKVSQTPFGSANNQKTRKNLEVNLKIPFFII